MTVAEKPLFAPTHIHDDGVPVMKNPDWLISHGPSKHWIDAEGNYHRTGAGAKAYPIAPNELPAITKLTEGGVFGATYARIGEIIPSEWYRTHMALEGGKKGVMVTREQAAVALRASSWPDSDAPCGVSGNSHDDEATCEGKDGEGNCIVRLFMRGKGYVKVRIPSTLFLEVVE